MINLVFKLDDWSVCRLTGEQRIYGVGLFAMHKSCTSSIKYTNATHNDISWLVHEAPKCWMCKCPVPDEIQALIHLHEWDVK